MIGLTAQLTARTPPVYHGRLDAAAQALLGRARAALATWRALCWMRGALPGLEGMR